MPIQLKTTNIEMTDAINEYINDKISQLERHYDHDPINIDIELERETGHHSGLIYRCEINVDMPHEKKVLRAASREIDLYAAIDTCIPKMKDQLEEERQKRDTLIKKGGRELKEMLHEDEPVE
jgi:putative sigma-54 modulation protein